ncbi:HupE/UreJ family protein [Sneathiella limimaris]|uniref:HupE/UreJ family protein n=1 Tax=Sneathiella limimaris TaxID=1964213 RepID=UPI00146F162A|nr:HupE/UreJ family protein [Sneathiella limimaris]
MKRVFLTSSLLLLATASPALAHTGHAVANDFSTGFLHPFFGLDHILAMIGVGLLATQYEGKLKMVLPATFVAVMALGGFLGLSAMQVPFMEQGILASVILLGAILAFGKKLPLIASGALVAIFALFHGAAHGVEMPLASTFAVYGAGMMVASTLLHAAGVAFGYAAPFMIRYAGAGFALVGMGLAAA